MRRLWVLIAAGVVAVALAGCPATEKPVTSTVAPSVVGNGQWSVYFSPDGGCTDAIVDALADAQRTVLVQAYSFTSKRIAKALIDAKGRGVDVRAILDRSQAGQRYSSADFLANSDIPTKIDRAHAIAHNKVMVIDGATVITGSFNFTKAAEEHNAENLLIIRDKELVARYTSNWKVHEAHSEQYQGRGSPL